MNLYHFEQFRKGDSFYFYNVIPQRVRSAAHFYAFAKGWKFSVRLTRKGVRIDRIA